MRCLNCGCKINDEKLKICPDCNEKLVFYKVPLGSDKGEESPKRNSTEKVGKSKKENLPKREKSPKAKSKAKIFVIGFLCVILCAALIIFFVLPDDLVPLKKSSKTENEDTVTVIEELEDNETTNKEELENKEDEVPAEEDKQELNQEAESSKTPKEESLIMRLLKNIKFIESEKDGVYSCSFPAGGLHLYKSAKQYFKVISPVDIQITDKSAQITFKIKCKKSRKVELDDYLLRNYGEEKRKKVWEKKFYIAEASVSAYKSSYELPSEELAEALILMDINEEKDIVIKFSNEVYIKQLKEMVHTDHLEILNVNMYLDKDKI